MYVPLELSKKMDIRLIPDRNPWKPVLMRAADEAEDVLSFLWEQDGKVLQADYRGDMQYLNEALLAKRKILYHAIGIEDYEEYIKNTAQDVAASKECISLFMMVNRWSRHKEVYKFDAELELALADAENIKLPIRILDRLPFDTFYIEFARDGIFSKNFHGAFISAVKKDAGYIIVIQRVQNDLKSMFGSCSLVPVGNKKNAIFIFDRTTTGCTQNERNTDWKEFSFFLINALLYMCASNSEITENEETKVTYRPTERVKNKYSEVRKWDCGYRYGASIRKIKGGKTKEDRVSARRQTAERHIPCIHTRRAHWHHYWTGKGRTELELRWIAPVVVGGERVTTAVIHKVEQ